MGDPIRCPSCGEKMIKKCWRCGTPRQSVVMTPEETVASTTKDWPIVGHMDEGGYPLMAKQSTEYKVTWFPYDKPQQSRGGLSSERTARALAENNAQYNPVIEKRVIVVSDWAIVANLLAPPTLPPKTEGQTA